MGSIYILVFFGDFSGFGFEEESNPAITTVSVSFSTLKSIVLLEGENY